MGMWGAELETYTLGQVPCILIDMYAKYWKKFQLDGKYL